MQRSRSRKLKGMAGTAEARKTTAPLLKRAPIAAAIMAAVPRLYAADAADTGALQEVVVTAEKRTENLQDVPLSITAISTEKLEQLNINNFNDYVKYLPSVAFQSLGPGFARVFMRGVSSGDNGNHSGPLPSVGVYLDEQPITTIQGALDIHIYDIERVEALAGPQGTLYGASSEAGTVRIITNKPDPSGFKAGYELEGNTVRGEAGYVAEGFANIPLSANAAVRLVGWAEHDGGYIDNVPGSFTYPQVPLPSGANPWTRSVCDANFSPPPAGCTTTPVQAKKRFNGVDTYGGRAALKVDLNDRWSITPILMGQKTDANGNFAIDPALPGGLSTQRYYPDGITDEWWQAALTVQGKVSNFDITYAGGYLKRDDHTLSDYTDYSFAYAKQTYYVSYVESNTGGGIDPAQHIDGRDHYRKMSHELRIATPKENALRFIGGLFYQRQQHYILQDYLIDQLPTFNSVTGWPQTLWLTDQIRVDRDYAIFGELSFDFTPKLTGTVGYRFFRYDNSLDGFFGFGLNNPVGSHTGEASTVASRGVACVQPGILGGPCVDLSNEVKKDGSTPKFNLTYKFDDDHMVYATYSRGFRPGGLNRRLQPPPQAPLATYEPDFLKNYEIGYKTSWLNKHLRFNGAFFWEDWNNFQFGFLGQNSFTIVRNAGSARIKGAEQELEWAAAPGLTLSAGATELDPKLSKDFCLDVDASGTPLPLSSCIPTDSVPSGTQLPTTPKFKGNLTARYTFPLASGEAHLQGSYVYQGASNSQLAPAFNALLGGQPAYSIADFAAGYSTGSFSTELFVDNVFDKRAELYRFSECTIIGGGSTLYPGVPICGQKPLVGIATPRSFGIRFGQRF
jgi:outer membrane receptor protein involved in Fe transport